jgi:hypothetical protein
MATADPRIDHAGLAPTARTGDPGTLVLSSEEGLLLGLSYVLPDRTELSGRLLLPVLDGVTAGIVLAKHPLRTTPRLQLGALAGFMTVGSSDFSTTFVGGGLATGVCLDLRCESLLSVWGALGWGRTFTTDQNRVTESEAMVVFGPNLLLALSPHFKLVAEFDACTADLTSVLIMAALRVHGTSWGADLGGIWLDDSLAPLLSLTWRTDVGAGRTDR